MKASLFVRKKGILVLLGHDPNGGLVEEPTETRQWDVEVDRDALPSPFLGFRQKCCFGSGGEKS